MCDFIDILGLPFDSSPVQLRLGKFGQGADVFDDTVDLYHSFPSRGITFVFRSGKLRSVMFYSQGRDGFSEYCDPLPFDLHFKDNWLMVEKKVGKSIGVSGRAPVPFPGRTESNWIKFTFDRWTLHVEFTSVDRDQISLITVSSRHDAIEFN